MRSAMRDGDLVRLEKQGDAAMQLEERLELELALDPPLHWLSGRWSRAGCAMVPQQQGGSCPPRSVSSASFLDRDKIVPCGAVSDIT